MNSGFIFSKINIILEAWKRCGKINLTAYNIVICCEIRFSEVSKVTFIIITVEHKIKIFTSSRHE